MRQRVVEAAAAAAEETQQQDGTQQQTQQVLDYLRCPITQELPRDPVVLLETGQTYDRSALQKWFAVSNAHSCPLTGTQLASAAVVPNHAVRSLLSELVGPLDALPPPTPPPAVVAFDQLLARLSAATSAAPVCNMGGLELQQSKWARDLEFHRTGTVLSNCAIILAPGGSVWVHAGVTFDHVRIVGSGVVGNRIAADHMDGVVTVTSGGSLTADSCDFVMDERSAVNARCAVLVHAGASARLTRSHVLATGGQSAAILVSGSATLDEMTLTGHSGLVVADATASAVMNRSKVHNCALAAVMAMTGATVDAHAVRVGRCTAGFRAWGPGSVLRATNCEAHRVDDGYQALGGGRVEARRCFVRNVKQAGFEARGRDSVLLAGDCTALVVSGRGFAATDGGRVTAQDDCVAYVPDGACGFAAAGAASALSTGSCALVHAGPRTRACFGAFDGGRLDVGRNATAVGGESGFLADGAGSVLQAHGGATSITASSSGVRVSSGGRALMGAGVMVRSAGMYGASMDNSLHSSMGMESVAMCDSLGEAPARLEIVVAEQHVQHV